MSVDTSEGHPAMDYDEHRKTYRLFIKLTQFVVVGVVLLLLAMAFFLT
ncbi:MAG: aa3-type cytochrome c oxidase subunit IV [Pseudomonadota bacterium]